MSHGPGVTQRAVLEVASRGRPFTVDDVLGPLGTKDERDSIMRAIRVLGTAGRLTLTRDHNGRVVSALGVRK
jgi:hypothetical protein